MEVKSEGWEPNRFKDKLFRDSSLEIEVMQDMLSDMVPAMDVIITEEMFDKYEEAVSYAMKTWDQYWEVTKDPKYKNIHQLGEQYEEYFKNYLIKFIQQQDELLKSQEDSTDGTWLYMFTYFFQTYVHYLFYQKKALKSLDERWFKIQEQPTNMDKFALDIFVKNFKEKHQQNLKNFLNIFFLEEQACTGIYEHQTILKTLIQNLYQMGYKKNIKLVEDNQAKYFVGDFDNDQNEFFKKIFEDNLLSSIKQHHKLQVDQILKNNDDLIKFVTEGKKIFDKQQDRGEQYYTTSIENIRLTLDKMLIKEDHLKQLFRVNDNLKKLFESEEQIDLAACFQCVYNSPSLVQDICSEYEKQIKNKLEQIKKNFLVQKNGIDLINDLIQFYDKHQTRCEQIFAVDKKVDLNIERTLDNTFRNFINQELKEQYCNCFAKYCDKNLEDYQENVTINKFDKIIKLYRLKINNDQFLKQYENNLGLRLLQNKIKSIDAEILFLDKLGTESQVTDVETAKQMIQDILNGKQLKESFIEQYGEQQNIKFDIKIINSRYWQAQFKKKFEPKGEFFEQANKFSKFYENKFENQILSWTYGNGEMQFLDKYVLIVSQQQMVILLFVNKQNKCSLQQIQKETELDNQDLTNSLSGLLSSQVLKTDGDIKKLNPQNVITVNESFSSNNIRINCKKLMQVHNKEPAMDLERNARIQSVMCSIMKQYKQKNIDQLFLEVRQSQFLNFQVQPDQLKRIMAEGINQKYYVKKQDDNNTLEYIT